MSYVQVQQRLDGRFPPGFRSYWKSNFLKDFNDSVIEIMVDHFARVPSGDSLVFLEHLLGAATRVGEEDTAFNHRGSSYNWTVLSMWADPTADDENVRWSRELWRAVQPFSAGVYVNYLGEEADEGMARIRAAYGPAKYKRLVILKDRYDPTNFFRLNQNIRPIQRSS